MLLFNYLRIISFSRSPLSRIPSCYFSCLKKNRTQNFEYESNKPNYTQQKLLSFNSVVDATMQSQRGIFKTLSESTPVEYCQNLLIGIHNTTGLPWWGTIICTTILLRSVVTVPLAAYQMYVLAKLELIKMEMPEIVQELKRETAIAIKLYNLDEKTARVMYNRSIRKQWNNLIVRENCHPFKTVLLVIFQIPMWISVSISLRNLMYMLPNQDLGAKLIFTELSTQGVAWIPNLIAADTSFILPLAFGLTNLVIIELQSLSKVTVPTKLQRYMTHVFRGLTICLIPIAASVPSGLVLYWTTSSVFGLVQNLLLMSPKVKRMCRIPLTPSELENPYRQVYLGLQYRLKIKSRVKNET